MIIAIGVIFGQGKDVFYVLVRTTWSCEFVRCQIIAFTTNLVTLRVTGTLMLCLI